MSPGNWAKKCKNTVVGVQKQHANQEKTTNMRKQYDKAFKSKVAL